MARHVKLKCREFKPYKTYFSKLFQVKIIAFQKDELHDVFDLLLVKDIANQEILAFVHNYFSNSLPPVFNGYFETLASNHNMNTRNGGNLLNIISHTTDIAASAIKIQGAKLWNKLDNSLKKLPKVKQFKAKYKHSVCLPYVKKPNH